MASRHLRLRLTACPSLCPSPPRLPAAVLLWEIVTGERPSRGDMRLPRDDECLPAVAQLIGDCMQLEPVDRPTALQLLERLDALVEATERQSTPTVAA